MSLMRPADLHAVPHHRGGRRDPMDRRHAGLRTDGPLRRGRRAGHHPPGIAITDARHYLIPDEYNWTGLVLGLGLSLTAGVPGFIEGVLGAATGFALLYAVGLVGGWVFKEEAMGGGDIKMMAMVGAFVGWKGVLLTIFAGALFGSLVYVPLLVLGKRKRHVPFGVFLAMGAAVAFVFGPAIYDWYRRFLGAA